MATVTPDSASSVGAETRVLPAQPGTAMSREAVVLTPCAAAGSPVRSDANPG